MHPHALGVRTHIHLILSVSLQCAPLSLRRTNSHTSNLVCVFAVRALVPEAYALTREWIEVSGPRQGCTPCADIAFMHFASVLGASVVQKECFFAFWPQYYSLSGYQEMGGWAEALRALPNEVAPPSCQHVRPFQGGETRKIRVNVIAASMDTMPESMLRGLEQPCDPCLKGNF